MNYRKLLLNLGIGTLIALPMVLLNAERVKAQRRVLIIHNHTDGNITDLFVSPDWSRYWGEDQLYGTLKPGDSATVVITGDSCLYDILGRDINGNEVPRGGFGEFNVCENDRFALTDNTMRVVQWP